MTNEFSKIPIISKRSHVKLESDRGAELYIFIFQNIPKNRISHHYSRYTDEGPKQNEWLELYVIK